MSGWFNDDDVEDYPTASTRGVTDEPERPAGLGMIAPEAPADQDESEPAPSPEPAEVGLDDPNWTPEHGFADPSDAIRIWADDDGGLARVRLAIGWRTRLRELTLDEALTGCFEAMNDYFHPDAELPVPEEQAADPAHDMMGWELLAEIRDQQLGMLEKLSQLTADVPSHWVGSEAVGDDWDDSVAVRLDVLGHPVAAAFVADWLAKASNHDITIGIMGAYRKARSRHVPPTVQWSEHAKLGQQAQRLRLGIHQAMRGGLRLGPDSLPY